jgi:hypothetical protein
MYAHTNQQARAPTFRSLRGSDILLTQAFYEQFDQLSWFQFSLGRITTKWARAVQAYQPERSTRDVVYWAVQVIHYLWAFTRGIWKHPNNLVHDNTVEENSQLSTGTNRPSRISL